MNEVEIAERLAALEQDKKAANHRIENLEKLTESVYSLAQSAKSMQENLKNIMARVAKIEERPVKRWEGVISTIITVLISGVGGFILSKIIGG